MEGKITISRVTSNTEPDFVLIQIEDENSGVRFVEAKLSLGNFAEVITGMGHISCEFKTRGLEKIGLTREHKTEEVYINFSSYPTKKASAESAIARYEVDGWKGDVEDAFNHHNFLRNHGDSIQIYSISYIRWV